MQDRSYHIRSQWKLCFEERDWCLFSWLTEGWTKRSCRGQSLHWFCSVILSCFQPQRLQSLWNCANQTTSHLETTQGQPTHAGGHCHSSGSSGALQGTDQALALDAHGKFGYDPCKSQSGRPPISWELLLGRHQLNPLPEGLSQHSGGTSRPDFGGSNGGGSRLTWTGALPHWIWVSQRGRLWLNLEMSVPGLCFEQPHSPPHSPPPACAYCVTVSSLLPRHWPTSEIELVVLYESVWNFNPE